MVVSDFSRELKGKLITGETGEDRQITGMYCCDLLSWVMSHGKMGDAWITVHTHLNVVAVATLAELSCIIVPEGIKVEETTIAKAIEQGIPMISTDLSSYEICCIACECGL